VDEIVCSFAETKITRVHDLASQYEYPLKATMEEA